MSSSDLQRRLEEEIAELEEKMISLRDFIKGERFKAIDPDHQELLKQQIHIMNMYYSILEDRIELVTEKE